MYPLIPVMSTVLPFLGGIAILSSIFVFSNSRLKE